VLWVVRKIKGSTKLAWHRQGPIGDKPLHQFAEEAELLHRGCSPATPAHADDPCNPEQSRRRRRLLLRGTTVSIRRRSAWRDSAICTYVLPAAARRSPAAMRARAQATTEVLMAKAALSRMIRAVRAETGIGAMRTVASISPCREQCSPIHESRHARRPLLDGPELHVHPHRELHGIGRAERDLVVVFLTSLASQRDPARCSMNVAKVGRLSEVTNVC